MIARLTAQLRCYVPEPVDETWGRLRHLGARREELIDRGVAQVQQVRDLLECVWPAALETAAQPFRSQTWAAALWRGPGPRRRGPGPDPTAGRDRFERAVRREITRRGGQQAVPADRPQPLHGPGRPGRGARAPPRRLGADPAGGRLGADQQRLAETENRMVAVLDELGLTALATSIPGISAVGAAAILAETGDPHRFTTARALVKHAGLAPREKLSGTFTGRTRLTGKGRPRLRVAAWRAVWGALQTNTVYAARYRHLTTRETQQAQAHPGPDRDRRRDPATAARRDHHRPSLGPRASPPTGPTERGHPGRLTPRHRRGGHPS